LDIGRYYFLILLLVPILFTTPSVFAYTIEYDVLPFKIQKIPNVCIFEPFDPSIPEINKELWVHEAETAVLEWKVKLEQVKLNKDSWDITQQTIPLNEQFAVDNSTCDVEIRLKAFPPEEFEFAAGVHWREGEKSQIEIYYMERELCDITTDEFFRYYHFCYRDDYTTSKIIGNIVRHEFGHALALGHYYSDNLDVNDMWVRGIVDAPSVMVDTLHIADQLQKIKPIDVEKVRDIYGVNGFIPALPNTSAISTLIISELIIQVSSYSTEQVEISGTVSDKEYKRGHPVVFNIENPDGTINEFAVQVSNYKMFSLPMMFSSNSQTGLYEMSSSYIGIVGPTIFFEVKSGVSEAPPASPSPIPIPYPNISTSTQLPDWIRNNAGWWADGLIGDSDFTLGIQFMMTENIIVIPDLPEQASETVEGVPLWVRNNAGWWAAGLISDEDFVGGIKYLVEQGIIVV